MLSWSSSVSSNWAAEKKGNSNTHHIVQWYKDTNSPKITHLGSKTFQLSKYQILWKLAQD